MYLFFSFINFAERNHIILSQSAFAAMITSIILLGFVLFSVGAICGCLGYKYKPLLTTSDKYPVTCSTQVPSVLEMTENVAYGPVEHGHVQ